MIVMSSFIIGYLMVRTAAPLSRAAAWSHARSLGIRARRVCSPRSASSTRHSSDSRECVGVGGRRVGRAAAMAGASCATLGLVHSVVPDSKCAV